MSYEITGRVTDSGWIPGGLGGWCEVRENRTGVRHQIYGTGTMAGSLVGHDQTRTYTFIVEDVRGWAHPLVQSTWLTDVGDA